MPSWGKYVCAVLGALLGACLPVQAGASKAAADVKALVGKIDRHIAARWQQSKARPAARADDATFLRRVYLDLTGRIPPVTEVRDFLDDTSTTKRTELVERLLKTDDYARHFATTWRRVILPPQDNIVPAASSFEDWLGKQFRRDVGYDRITRAILTAPITARSLSGVGAFYQANGYTPENLGASVSRIFLGVRLECAQCHNHPFAKWTRKQFWEFAAFFGGTGPQEGRRRPSPVRAKFTGRLTIPGTEKVVQARILGASAPAAFDPTRGPRPALADWMVKGDNPFFARTAVNRLWAHFFGIGLVEPPDEMDEGNRPSHPELLKDLASAFAARRFDVRFLIRAITASRAYQLSSVASHPSQNNLRLLARMPVRGLTGEQLYDSLARIRGRGTTPAEAAGRTEFLARFANQDRPTESHTSLLQALNLMNGRLLADMTSLEKNRALRTLAEARGRTAGQRVEELYLLVLSRPPRPKEKARLVKYVESGGERRDSKKALADILWVLLNSHDFCLNH
jgi:hypothetical protein